ncbi:MULTISPECIES: hypothetical protein [unclassified Chryseobacterium]|uniref:hypothetical protein n=1 Tax=unclassified Chryseobacterium TaxID=2593645 RepID=UPI000D366E7A|nr:MULTISPECIES: hypothetical protein [unclassified Chryseobacterium]PTT76392.1 hypothetical protein DBR25_06040 [Chryseobacterium sp. HMWF001]PVV50432.1 hypothetical protein DD829_22475 [Chryseobacterium sp. HMWF035]
MPALKAQAGDFGLTYEQLQELKPYEFYIKVDHHKAIKIQAPSFLLKNPKRYFGLSNEVKSLKEYVLNTSGLYHSTDHQPVEVPPENNQYVKDYVQKTDTTSCSSPNNNLKNSTNPQTKTNPKEDFPKGIPAKYSL